MAQPEKAKWYYSAWFVLVSLFVILGPLGLPLLWKSPRFSERAKWFLTAATVIAMGFLVYFSSRLLQQLVDQVRQLGAA